MAWVRNRGTGRKKRWEIHWVDEHNVERQEMCSQTTREDAQDFADELEARAERIRRGVEKKEVPRITLSEVCHGTFKDPLLRAQSKGFFGDVVPTMALSKERERLIERHILEHLGDRYIGELLPIEVDRWTQMLQTKPRGTYENAPQKKNAKKPLSANTVIGIRALLSSIYRYLRKKLKIPVENPVADAESILKPEPDPKYIELEHIGPLLANVPAEYRTLFVTAVCLGPRKGEIAGLLCSDVDLKRRLIKIRRSYDHQTTKTKRSRFVAIPKFLMGALSSQVAGRRPDSLLFPVVRFNKAGEREEVMMHPKKDLVRILRSALKKARIISEYEYTCRKGKSLGRNGKKTGRAPVEWGCELKLRKPVDEKTMCPKCDRKMWVEAKAVQHTFKDLRATFATYALETSGDLDFVQRQMGHAEGSDITRANYAKLRAQRAVAHADRLPFAEMMPAGMLAVAEEQQPPFDDGPASEDFGSQLAGPNRKAVARATNLYQARSSQVSGDKEKHDGVTRNEKRDGGLGYGSTGVQSPLIDGREVSEDAEIFAEPITLRTEQRARFGSQLAGAGRNAVTSGATRRFRVVDGDAQRLFTVKQVAAHLAISTATVYAMIERGELAVSRFASSIRVRQSDLDALIKRCAVGKGGSR